MESSIKQLAKAIREDIIAIRHDIHQHPELSFQEERTAQKVETYLKGLGLETHRISNTGVWAMIQGEAGPGKTLALRA
ncbi:MAG: hypothetical protein RLZZ60_1517, partial [Bacteroidota bacterium]